MTKSEKQEFGEAGNLSLASASGAITGDFCEIRCIGSTTFTALVDTLERTTAEYGRQATGTITFTGLPVADETFAVAGETFSFKAESTGALEVEIGADANATATNAATMINGALEGIVVAAASGGVVTVTSVIRGTGGNGTYTLTESATNVAVSGGGSLAGGTDLITAASLTYPDGHILRGKFTTIHLAGGNARVTLSSALPG